MVWVKKTFYHFFGIPLSFICWYTDRKGKKSSFDKSYVLVNVKNFEYGLVQKASQYYTWCIIKNKASCFIAACFIY